MLVESLLQGGKGTWSVRQLAAASNVSPGFAQRVTSRLEDEALLTSSGLGPKKTRIVNNPMALAESWSRDEKVVKPALRGFLYGSSDEAIARRIPDLCPGCAIGEAVAAIPLAPCLPGSRGLFAFGFLTTLTEGR